MPGAVFSGKQRPAKGVRGVFFCFALPGSRQGAGANSPTPPAPLGGIYMTRSTLPFSRIQREILAVNSLNP